MANVSELRLRKLYPRRSPKQKVQEGIFSYAIFTIIISWSPIIINYFISYMFKVPVKQLISYKSEICFMAIILASDNIKRLVDLMHYRFLKRTKWFFKLLLFFNIINIALPLLYLAISSYLQLAGTEVLDPAIRQYHFILITYILTALMGLGVQIGGKIWIN